ncbi:TetR/AcrR family transcriptional regulator [Ketobacter sp. MCCC 1A13808]|uniref:TetR/AcrR family transcriptional regulator n=1 Tax=Ketobacter sp. MCCC 1A13808 TaxID=2602738 RepID=UPI0012EBA614|nr:TetR/AcrR family transcriptional regulator [Ketobacter sp. MCCC 1A13808]MVF12027.1 TetR/AcrR family transcriptional regulator [Ketobacter sp. MCCC 1A13808]
MSKARGRPLDKDRIKRDKLLELAFQEFSEHDFKNVSIRKLAADVGVSDSLFIHHFGSKQKLWYEVVDTLIEREFKSLIAQYKQLSMPTQSFDLLRENIAELFRLAKLRPAMFRLFFRELNSDSERADYLKRKYLHPYLLLFDAAIDLCIKRGDIKPLNPLTLHTLLLGSINILINPGLLKPGLNFADEQQDLDSVVAEELVDTIFNGATSART